MILRAYLRGPRVGGAFLHFFCQHGLYHLVIVDRIIFLQLNNFHFLLLLLLLLNLLFQILSINMEHRQLNRPATPHLENLLVLGLAAVL